MGRDFTTETRAELDATPEQVWEAIATGPGIDSWFIGRNEVLPGQNGAVRTSYGDYTPESAVTAWDPLRRFAYSSGEAQDGRFIAYEFRIEGRAGSSTVLRTVTSGFLPGDDWQDEYDAMTKGLALFFATLVEQLTYFPSRTATSLTAFGPPVTDWPHAWSVLHAELGLSDAPAAGDPVRSTPDGLPRMDGLVYFTNPHSLALRTDDAMYRFLRGLGGGMVVGHHVFSADPLDSAYREQAELAWQSWLVRLFS